MAKLPGWKDLPLGIAILEPGNAQEYRTGEWRSAYPRTDEDRCIACGMCWIMCPDSSRRRVPRKRKDPDAMYPYYFDFNFNYCKGCGICAAECPTGAIVMIEEGS